jgi:hypothetical protein
VVAGGAVFLAVYGAGIVVLGVRQETRELFERGRARMFRRGPT